MTPPSAGKARVPMRRDPRDEAMEVMIGQLLRGGVVLSALLLAAGLVWRFATTGSLALDYRIENMTLYEFFVADLRQIAAGALSPRLLVSLGIAVLLATPYVRVLASLVYFALVERDLKYTFFTAFVFAVLTYSLALR